MEITEDKAMEETKEAKAKLQEILSNIQRKLKAPKNQFNSFGNYHYRNCEDILEAVKPLLPDGAYVCIGDSIEMIGTRYYVKATASLSYGGVAIDRAGYAREPESRKGMDESQITGATSSYARKYALNGLFLIDDTKDADSKDNRDTHITPKVTPKKPENGPVTQLPPAAVAPPQAQDSSGPIIWNAGNAPEHRMKPGYRGKDIREVPGDYLEWYEKNGPQDNHREMARLELDRRDAQAQMEMDGGES
jgi:hypothetical protein